MRKFLAVGAVAAAAALTLSACGSSATTGGTSAAPASASAKASMSGKLTVWIDANRQPVLKTVAENFTDSRDIFRLRGKTIYEHV